MTHNDTTKKTKAWIGDELNRKEEGGFLSEYLVNKYLNSVNENDKNFVLNVNADWGFGKTYFLENIFLELEEKGHQVVYFDAWKNDFSDKPMLGFITEINDSLSLFMSKGESRSETVKSKIGKKLSILKKAAAPLIAGFLAKQLVGASFEQVEHLFEDEVKGEDTSKSSTPDNVGKDVATVVSSITTKAAEFALKEHVNTKGAIETFKKNLGDLINYIDSETDKKLPLFILVDELDRCRPNYAIELLETIKHLFQVKGVYFIVATASHQLSHSINAVYGNDFESKRYLNRFFDQEYELAIPNQLKYCQYQWDKYIPEDNSFLPLFNDNYYKNNNAACIDMNVILVDAFARYTRAGLRDIEQAIRLMQAINLTYTDPVYTILVLFLIFCKVRHPDLYILVKKAWPDISSFDKNSRERIKEYEAQYFDQKVFLYQCEFDSQARRYTEETIRLETAVKQILSLNGIVLESAYDNVSHSNYAGRLLIKHCKMACGNNYSIDNPEKIKLSHYIEIVEQVGKLS